MQTQRTEIDGMSVQYVQIGTPTPEHETLLFLHGWGAPTAVYPRLLSFIGGYLPVIAPDLPGFGGTDEPETPWGVSEYADFVLHFAEKLGLQKVLLMGHSHGGRVSIEIASRDTLPFALTRLVLMDAAGVLPKKTFRQKLRQRQYKICRAVLETRFCRALYPDALENLRRSHGSADYLNATPMMRQTLVKCVNTDMTPKMPSIKQPALLLWGEKDTATPLSDGQTMEKLIPGAALVTIPGGSHFPFLEDWGLFSRVLGSYLSSDNG